MADSRLLDDVEELILPLAIAVGGIYLIWWTTRTTETLIEAVPQGINQAVQQVIDYDLPFVGEGDFIDRWTYNPQEFRSDLGRIASGVGNAGARIRRWLPW